GVVDRGPAQPTATAQRRTAYLVIVPPILRRCLRVRRFVLPRAASRSPKTRLVVVRLEAELLEARCRGRDRECPTTVGESSAPTCRDPPTSSGAGGRSSHPRRTGRKRLSNATFRTVPCVRGGLVDEPVLFAALTAGLILVTAVLYEPVQRSLLTEPLIAVVLGVAVGPEGL